MLEIWKPVAGWPYETSNLGGVRRVGGAPLSPRKHSNGYLRVQLSRHGEQRDEYVHRLVLAAFDRPPAPGEEADHIDRDRTNNSITNLRWLTVSANRARRVLPSGEQHGNAKLTAAAVDQIRTANDPKLDKVIAAQWGVSRETVRDVRLCKHWRQ